MSESKETLLLEKFLAGTATGEEEAWLREWSEMTLSQPAALDFLRACWERSPRASEMDRMIDREVRWQALRAKTRAFPDGLVTTGKTPRIPNTSSKRQPLLTRIVRLSMAARIGGGLVTALVLGGIIWFGQQWTDGGMRSNAMSREYVTGKGQRAVVQLADGSRATLAPDTKLRFTMSKKTHTRTAEVDGEAFFSVEPSSASPFVVQAGHAITRVLGTGFGVRWYRGDSAVRVAVVSGRVMVQRGQSASTGNTGSSRAQSVILSANDVTHVAPAGPLTSQHDADLTAALGWRTGTYVFRMVPASLVAAELSRAYDLDIQFSDAALGRQLLTLSFATDQQSAMLDIFVSAMLDVHAERRGRTVILSRIAR